MPGPQLDIKLERAGGTAVVTLIGVVDAATVDSVKRAIEPLIEQHHPRILVDGGGLSFINSIGFGLFLSWTRACAARQGHFGLCGLRDRTRGIIKILGMEPLLNIYPSQAEALILMNEGSAS